MHLSTLPISVVKPQVEPVGNLAHGASGPTTPTGTASAPTRLGSVSHTEGGDGAEGCSNRSPRLESTETMTAETRNTTKRDQGG